MRKIPSTMSTQHPDNVQLPSWASSETISGESEVYETFFVYDELKCEEQMWDWEGKDVDPNIVRKLLVNYPKFFREHVIGRDVFLTYRVPNPSVERTEKKSLIEALESIPRCYDIAESFYKRKACPPIFEVIFTFHNFSPRTSQSHILLQQHNRWKRKDETARNGKPMRKRLGWQI